MMSGYLVVQDGGFPDQKCLLQVWVRLFHSIKVQTTLNFLSMIHWVMTGIGYHRTQGAYSCGRRYHYNYRKGKYRTLCGVAGLAIERVENATPIPTLNEWGLILFSLLPAVVSVFILRRQRKTV